MMAEFAWRRGHDGGGSGIRTHDTVARIHAFQACAFSHSAIPPRAGRAGANIDAGTSERKLASRPAGRGPIGDAAGRPLRCRNRRALCAPGATWRPAAPRQRSSARRCWSSSASWRRCFLLIAVIAAVYDGTRSMAADTAGDDLAPGALVDDGADAAQYRAGRRQAHHAPAGVGRGARPAAAAAGLRSCSSCSAFCLPMPAAAGAASTCSPTERRYFLPAGAEHCPPWQTTCAAP